MRIESSAQEVRVKSRRSDETARLAARTHRPFQDAAIWLYKAELQPSSVQLPRPFSPGQLQIVGPAEGGNCSAGGGRMHASRGKCVSVRAPGCWCRPWSSPRYAPRSLSAFGRDHSDRILVGEVQEILILNGDAVQAPTPSAT
jgi:hypothetical protein